MSPNTIIRSDDLRAENRRRLIEALRALGPSTPYRLCEFTGLSAASVSTLRSEMVEQGILQSEAKRGSTASTGRGRPSTPLNLNPNAARAVTVNLKIDHIQTQCIDYLGNVIGNDEVSVDTRSLSIKSLISKILCSIRSVYTEKEALGLAHIGVAFQGMTELESGMLLWSPILNHTNIPLGETLRTEFNAPVSVDNDCRLIALALSQNHADHLGDSFATVLFSHGIGLGLYLNGQPFTGTRSSALELGHLKFEHKGALCRCGKLGCIEAYAADYGIMRMAKGQNINDVPMGRLDSQAMQSLIDQAQQGDQATLQAFTIAGAAVGEGLVNLFTLLDPIPVALVGQSKQAFQLMGDGIETILSQNLRTSVDWKTLLHSFEDETPLLEQGLITHCLTRVDQSIAETPTSRSIRA